MQPAADTAETFESERARAPASPAPVERSARAEATAPSAAAPAPTMGIGRAALIGVIGAGAGMVFTILRSKVTAVALGPDGIGKAAEILQLITLGNLAATTITGPALISSLAEARGRGDYAAIARLARAATTLVLIVSGAGGLLAVLAGFFLLPAPWGPRAFPLTLLAALAALLTSWALIPQQVLAAHLEIKRQTALRLVLGAIGTALTCAATWLLGLTGQFLAAALAAAVSLPVAFRLTRARIAVPAAPSRSLDRPLLLKALKVGGSALLAGYGMQVALLVTRGALERHGGASDNGQFQAAWSIGSLYIAMLLDGAGSYVLPRYAAAPTEVELAEEMRAATRFVLRSMIPFFFAAIVLRGVMVRALYDHRFDAAIELVGLQLVGDITKTISWVHVGPLLYRNKPRAFLATEIPATILLGLGAALLVPRFGLRGFGYAYLGMNVAYAFSSALAVSRSCGVPVDLRRLGLGVFWTLAALLVLYLDRAFAATRWIVLACVLAFWQQTGALAGFFARVRGKLAPIFLRPASPRAGPKPSETVDGGDNIG